MSQPSTEQALLDEKIARIREKNEKIIKKQELIQKEIELAKKHNAMVDVKAPKISEDDLNPTLYADAIEKPHRTKSTYHHPENLKRERSTSNKINFKLSNSNDDSVWRAERNQIDEERIRRQKADSGWIREWDANKNISDEESVSAVDNSFSSRGHSDYIRSARSSQHFSAQEERSESSVFRQNQSMRRRPLTFNEAPSGDQAFKARSINNQNSNKTRDLLQTINTSPHDSRKTILSKNVMKEKSALVKRVSWNNENDLVDSPRISLEDGSLKNIKVKVNSTYIGERKRSIEVTEERGLFDKFRNSSKFDEKTSLNIKDSVSKTISGPSLRKRFVVRETIYTPKQKDTLVRNELKNITKDRAKLSKTNATILHTSEHESVTKDDEIEVNDDEEWEDLSDGEWESASDNE